MNHISINIDKRLSLVVAATFFFFLFSFSYGFSQEGDNRAVVAFDKTSFDFGELNVGDGASAVFKVTNKGNAPLVIENVTASCGCTVARWAHEPVMPKDTASIIVTYNTNIVGEIKRSVVVKTNDRDNRRTILLLTGEVLLPTDEE